MLIGTGLFFRHEEYTQHSHNATEDHDPSNIQCKSMYYTKSVFMGIPMQSIVEYSFNCPLFCC